MDTVEITELEKIDATRVDGVGVPANGIPILLLKSVGVAKGARDCPKCDKTYDADHKGSTCENCGTTLPDAPAAKSLPDWHAEAVALVKKAMVRGKVDETADIDGGQQAIALVGKLIGYEAQELAAGNLGEAADIELLSAAAQLLRQWVSGESAVQDGNVMPATALMQSAADGGAEDYRKYAESLFAPLNDEVARLRAQLDVAKADMSTADVNDLPDSAFAYIEPGGSKDADGKTTPRSLRHFPVHDEAHAKNALARASQSPFGDKAMPKIKAAAKKFGIDDDASKSEIAKDGATVDTVTQETGGLSKAVEEAIAKATAPLAQEIADLKAAKDLALAELAKVKATPVPGGPMMSVVRPAKAADGEDPAKKAAYYEDWAERLSSPEDADRYRQLAAQERAKITS
jgi:hypothetical protein